MTRMTSRKRLAALASTVLAALTLASAALAGSTPTVGVYSSTCTPYTASSIMAANYSILAANRYAGWGENQIVYVQATLYSHTTGSTVNTTPWIYGRAYDSTGPLAWFRYDDDAYLGDAAYRLTFIRIPRGTYQVGVRFAWDASAWGAPSGSTGWIWSPGTCTFTY
jgi:hypothetical protein